MNMQELERIRGIQAKYSKFISSLPGIMYVAYDDKEIIIYVKPENVELAKQFVSNLLDGIPVNIKPRTRFPLFIA